MLYPQNWLRPRFRWLAANGETLFELHLHVPGQPADLFVYTTSTSWTMPVAMWDALRTTAAGAAVTIGIRGGVPSGGARGAGAGNGDPLRRGAGAGQRRDRVLGDRQHGDRGNSVLKGFSPGEESVQEVLTPAQFSQAQQTTSQCIGCHTATPDGTFAAFTTTSNLAEQQWSDALALIDPSVGAVGTAPSFLKSGAAAAPRALEPGAIAFSAAHWSDGDRRAVVSYDNGASPSNIGLAWIDHEPTHPAAASGTLAPDGDTDLAGAPARSHDRKTHPYVSTNPDSTGRLGSCTPAYEAPADVGSRADLYAVPYAGEPAGRRPR